MSEFVTVSKKCSTTRNLHMTEDFVLLLKKMTHGMNINSCYKTMTSGNEIIMIHIALPCSSLVFYDSKNYVFFFTLLLHFVVVVGFCFFFKFANLIDAQNWVVSLQDQLFWVPKQENDINIYLYCI